MLKRRRQIIAERLLPTSSGSMDLPARTRSTCFLNLASPGGQAGLSEWSLLGRR